MIGSDAGPPRVRPRQSLSGRLWLLATLAVLLSEVVVFLPYVAHERSSWLAGHVEDASIAVLAAGSGGIDAERRGQLLALAGAEAIRLTTGDGDVLTLGTATPRADADIDLRQEDLLVRVRRSVRAILAPEDRLLHVTGDSRFPPGATIELWAHERRSQPDPAAIRRATSSAWRC